ncbi:YitT family protein [Catenovulum sp. SM1970]|nr:YitT family protein [Marinifaba aquimaris]
MIRHPIIEDFLACVCASFLMALGVMFFKEVGLLTGGAAGIALIIDQLTNLSFGQAFALLNLPFYILAWFRMSKRFTINSVICVVLISIVVDQLHFLVSLENIDPIFAALMGGSMMGISLIMLFRHQSSAGGLGVLALFLQDKFGIRAGKFQMAADVMILVASFFLVSPYLLVLSVVGAIVLNVHIALNHKPGRYNITG